MAELTNRNQHEAAFARKLGKLAGRHRRELIDLLGHPPDVNRVPESFWQRVERETEEELAAVMLLLFILAAAQHGADNNQADRAGRSFASIQAAQSAASYSQTGREMLQTAGRDWRDTLRGGGDVLKRDVLDRATKIFGPNRVSGIAASETTNASSSGGEFGVEVSVGLSEDDTWFTEADARVCPICQPLHKQPREVWALKFPSGPPAHHRCRCWIQYAARAGTGVPG